MIIHISRQRYEFIARLGYGLLMASVTPPAKFIERGALDTEYHLLDDEYGFCKPCGEAFDSVDANTPVELETIKACPERAVIALRNLRQEMALQFKNTMEAQCQVEA